ncbi:hypothetical protein SLS62_010091 [Diatrype stigma]|uniref:Protein prenyltransferase n=1 Tax=Diatrype stigma TaxID=117547 RepID=A0AAN9UIC4_9PEZI
MSRSLDQDVLARLKAQDPKAVYNQISSILTDLPANYGLLEIEVLGEGYPLEPGAHFLRDGAAVAIPKLKIAQAFFVGRQVLQEHLLATGSDCVDDQVIRAASTLLLMDPEHITASNVRKRALLSRLEKQQEGPSLLLKRELQFVDSLLTSHLHRHTKSPTLWGHRRWLLEQFATCGIPIDVRQHMGDVVMVSGERHPRNYYAWGHARWLFHDLGRWDIDAALAATIAGDVKRWCFKHPYDISGWTFLMFLLERVPDEDTELRRTTQEGILMETLELADSFRWANESVWVFLRTIMAKDDRSRQRYREPFTFTSINDKLSSRVEKDPVSLGTLQRARSWYDKYHIS